MKIFLLLFALTHGLFALGNQGKSELQSSTSLRAAIAARLRATGASDPLLAINTTGINQITNLTDLNQENEWMDLDPTTIIVISVFLIVVGAIILLFGYRLLSFSAFICGGLIAAVILFGILASAISNDDPAKREIVYYSCLGAWLVFGIVAACCLQFAIFVLGAALGVFVAVLLNPVALQYVWIQHAFSDIYIWIAVFALIGGILACFLQRPLIIISTALGGALFHRHRNLQPDWRHFNNNSRRSVPDKHNGTIVDLFCRNLRPRSLLFFIQCLAL